MKINKLSAIEAIALILIITINRLAINIPQAILLSCGSSSILNAVYISLITILLVYLIVKLFKIFPNSDIIDVSEFLGSKFLKYLIGIILFIRNMFGILTGFLRKIKSFRKFGLILTARRKISLIILTKNLTRG